MLTVVAIFLLTMTSRVTSFSSGAPSSRCSSMLTGHGVEPQTSVSSVRLSPTNSDCFVPNQNIQLQISGGSFKGFMLQARPISADATYLGHFSPASIGCKLLACDAGERSAVTHDGGSVKTSVLVSWLPPMESPDKVLMRLTVVESFTVLWTNVDTILNKCPENKTTTTAPMPTTTTTTTTTTTLPTTTTTTTMPTSTTTTTTTTTTMPTTTTTTQTTTIPTTTTTTTVPSTSTTMPSTTSTLPIVPVTSTSTTPPTTSTARTLSTTQSRLTMPTTTTVPATFPQSTTAFTTILVPQGTCPETPEADMCKYLRPLDCYSMSGECCKTCYRYMTMLNLRQGCEYGDRISICSFIPRNYCSVYASECCRSCP